MPGGTMQCTPRCLLMGWVLCHFIIMNLKSIIWNQIWCSETKFVCFEIIFNSTGKVNSLYPWSSKIQAKQWTDWTHLMFSPVLWTPTGFYRTRDFQPFEALSHNGLASGIRSIGMLQKNPTKRDCNLSNNGSFFPALGLSLTRCITTSQHITCSLWVRWTGSLDVNYTARQNHMTNNHYNV